jgi:hypothetical protein
MADPPASIPKANRIAADFARKSDFIPGFMILSSCQMGCCFECFPLVIAWRYALKCKSAGCDE